MNNNGLNQDKMNNIKNLVDSGDISGAISQISPEMIESFSKMLSANSGNSSNTSNFNNSNSSNNSNNSNSNNSYSQNNSNIKNMQNKQNRQNTQYNQNINYDANKQNSNYSQNGQNNSNSSNNGFDFGNIDMNTVLKMKSVMEKMNNTNDPRSNLLYSLKPYLRETKQEKLEQYVNLLNVSKIADILKNDKKDGKNA